MKSKLTRLQAISLLIKELDRAEKLHPEWPKDLIHQSAIVAEESGELTRACLNFVYHKENNLDNIVEEAIHTGAMAIRFLINLSNNEE